MQSIHNLCHCIFWSGRKCLYSRTHFLCSMWDNQTWPEHISHQNCCLWSKCYCIFVLVFSVCMFLYVIYGLFMSRPKKCKTPYLAWALWPCQNIWQMEKEIKQIENSLSFVFPWKFMIFTIINKLINLILIMF